MRRASEMRDVQPARSREAAGAIRCERFRRSRRAYPGDGNPTRPSRPRPFRTSPPGL